MTFDEFITKYLGKKVDWDNAYGGQCMDLYRQYVNDVLQAKQSPPVSGAADVWNTYLPECFDRITNTPTGVPSNGDVVIWNKNVGRGYGHIAIFISGDVNSFVSLDQNWPTLSVVTKTKHNYTNVLGWLHPKESMADLPGNYPDIIHNSSQWDEVCKSLSLGESKSTQAEAVLTLVAGLRARNTDLGNQLGTAQAEVKNREEQLSRLDQEMLILVTKNKELETRVDKLLFQVDTFAKDKGLLAIQIEQLNVQIDTLKQAQSQGEWSITLKDLFNLIWNGKITIKK